MALTEVFLSALLAPVMMFVQSRFVAEILSGKEVGWGSQQRQPGRITMSEVAHAHLGHTIAGLFLALATFSLSTQVWVWLSPIWLPLLLCVPVVFLTSRLSA
jgi:membrane glycosyltransferase